MALSQLWISLLNTTFTAIYLVIGLHLFGVHLPLTKTMIAITFIVGLLPIIGNLTSNTIVVVVSLAHSPAVAVASLVFLVVIHKLEYFLGARIVGSRIKSQIWELLIAMMVMEALFGVPGPGGGADLLRLPQERAARRPADLTLPSAAFGQPRERPTRRHADRFELGLLLRCTTYFQVLAKSGKLEGIEGFPARLRPRKDPCR